MRTSPPPSEVAVTVSHAFEVPQEIVAQALPRATDDGGPRRRGELVPVPDVGGEHRDVGA
jgi:hypothetical protein